MVWYGLDYGGVERGNADVLGTGTGLSRIPLSVSPSPSPSPSATAASSAAKSSGRGAESGDGEERQAAEREHMISAWEQGLEATPHATLDRLVLEVLLADHSHSPTHTHPLTHTHNQMASLQYLVHTGMAGAAEALAGESGLQLQQQCSADSSSEGDDLHLRATLRARIMTGDAGGAGHFLALHWPALFPRMPDVQADLAIMEVVFTIHGPITYSPTTH